MKKQFLTIVLLIFSFVSSAYSQVAEHDKEQIIRAWRLTDLYTEKSSVDVDTLLTGFQVHNPVFRQSISNSYLGNAGLAAMSNIFNRRVTSPDFIFISHYLAYLDNPDKAVYYNTKRPFSLIGFSSGGATGKNEKMLNVLHTQNVNPDFNIGFSYFNINSDGQYSNQEAITNAISFFASYELDNYEFHSNLNLNSARVFENGGLVDERSLYNEDFETEDHVVRLQNARNNIRNNNFFLSQSWKPFFYAGRDTLSVGDGGWFSNLRLFHVLKYNQYKRTYHDEIPGSGFYPEVLISNASTFDSVYFRNMTNTLMLELPVFDRGNIRFNAKGGIKNELLKGSYNIRPDTIFIYNGTPVIGPGPGEPVDTIVSVRNDIIRQSNALTATARGTAGEIFSIWGEAEYYFQGHRAGEYDLQAGIGFDFFSGKNRSVLEAGIRQREITPSLFTESFSSNHFSWNNSFSRVSESKLGGSVRMPLRNLYALAEFSLLNNYIYFDTSAHPVQHRDVIPVFSLSLHKDFRVWRFYFRNVISYQVSGNTGVLPLPELSIYQSTWFEQYLIRGIMTVQIGFDLYFTTSYRGYAYQPATSQFYLQREAMFGEYPYLDVFINIKHKRTRVFLKAEHINAGMIPPEYFTVLHYPRNEQMLKFGLSWSFYN